MDGVERWLNGCSSVEASSRTHCLSKIKNWFPWPDYTPATLRLIFEPIRNGELEIEHFAHQLGAPQVFRRPAMVSEDAGRRPSRSQWRSPMSGIGPRHCLRKQATPYAYDLTSSLSQTCSLTPTEVVLQSVIRGQCAGALCSSSGHMLVFENAV